MTYLPRPSAIPGVVRAGNWWHSKLPPLLSVVYAAALVFALPTTQVAGLWWAALISILGIASYGHVVNDAFDIEVDRKAGKANAMAGFTVWQRWAVALLLLAASFAPAALLPFGAAATALVAVNCLLPTLYSVPPVRIKERGVWALLFDAGGAHVVPTLWISLVSLRLAGGDHRWGWAFTVVMTLWALTVGIKGILRHQIFDLASDEQAGIATFSNRLNLSRVAEFLERRWYVAELVMFAGAVALLAPSAPLLPIAALAYLPVELKKQSLGWRFKFDARDPVSQPHRPLVNNYFYELALPVVLLAHLTWRQPWLGWLLPLHLTLFWKNVFVQWADLRRLVQHAGDVRAGRESLLRYRGCFEQSELARGTLRVLAGNPAHYQLRVIATDGQMDHLRFCHGPWQVERGQIYAVRFRARSHALRQATVGLRQYQEPWAGLGLDVPIVMDARWRTYEMTFAATADEGLAVLFVTLGDAVGPVEIEGVQLAPVAGECWALMCERPFLAQCVADSVEGRDVVRVEFLDRSDEPAAVRMHRLGVRLAQGRSYRLRLTLRADRPRHVAAGVCRHGGDWSGLGLAETIQVDDRWRTYVADFIALETEGSACGYVWLGGSTGWVELAEAAVEEVSADNSRQLICHHGVRAHLLSDDDGRTLRLQILERGRSADHVRLCWPTLALHRGEYYSATLELRADRPRRVTYGVSQSQEPFAGLGLNGEWDLTGDWQTHVVDFRATDDESAPSLYLLAGDDDAAVEVRTARIAPTTHRRPMFIQFAPELGPVAHKFEIADDITSSALVAIHGQTQRENDTALLVEGFSVSSDREYSLTFEARAAHARSIGVGLQEADQPWENLGLSATVQVTSAWRTYVIPVAPTTACRAARVSFWLGGDQHAVEIRSTELHDHTGHKLAWEFRCAGECSVQCVRQDAGHRLELIRCGLQPTDAQVVFRLGPVRRGRRYRVRLRLKADERRGAVLALGQRHSPWQGLATDVSIELDRSPQAVIADFVAKADEPDAAVYLHVGDHPAAINFSDIECNECDAERTWRVSADGDARATAVPVAFDDSHVRVEVRALGQRFGEVKLVHGDLSVEQARWYAVRFCARAAMPRTVTCGVQQDHAPWQGLGYFQEVALTEQWQTFLGGFEATLTESHAALSWNLGASRHAVEIDDVDVSAEDSFMPLKLSQASGCGGFLLAGKEQGTLRCLLLATRGGAADVRLTRPLVEIEAGQRYRLQFQARADAPRECAVSISQGAEPWTGLGLYRTLNLNNAWQSFAWEFEATGGDSRANLSFFVGQSLVPLELRAVELCAVAQPATTDALAGRTAD